MQQNKRRFTRILSLVVVASLGMTLFSGCGFKEDVQTYRVNLEVWGIFDDSDAYTQAFSDYRKINPYVGDIVYRKLSVDTYKQDLLDALAAGKGPDVFMIRNVWLPDFQDKVVAAPDYIVDERTFRNQFVDVVADDFIGSDGKMYGFPLSVDSLALYYNKDLLNAAGIGAPPATWEEFATDAQFLSKVDAFGNITQSGAAMGTSYNINRSTDILTALLLQRGVPLWSKERKEVDLGGRTGEEVLDFYTRFASVSSPLYSWNPRMHYSIDAFYEGQVGMMVNYSWHYATLKRKNAKLNFGVAPLPRFSDSLPRNYANYWGFVVAKNKYYDPSVANAAQQNQLRVHESWQLMKFLALAGAEKKMVLRNGITGNTKEFPLASDPTQMYLEKTQKPAARRDLVEAQKNDPFLGPFAEGNLNAKGWYQFDAEAVEGVLADMINSVNLGQNTIHNALELAQTRISRLMRR
jgi:ABC-type glycerol-3-phosphate transport system substrate-binding protein